MKTQHLLIQGRVQGVWFRESMRREAERLGVTGWVRNTPDGAVEAVVQGPAEAVDALVEWARSGPPMARVDGIEIEASETHDPLSGFEKRIDEGRRRSLPGLPKTSRQKKPGSGAGQNIHQRRRIGGDNTRSLCRPSRY